MWFKKSPSKGAVEGFWKKEMWYNTLLHFKTLSFCNLVALSFVINVWKKMHPSLLVKTCVFFCMKRKIGLPECRHACNLKILSISHSGLISRRYCNLCCMQKNTHVYYYKREGGSNKPKRKAERSILILWYFSSVNFSPGIAVIIILPAMRWSWTVLSIQIVALIFFRIFKSFGES